jgi:hypothetical protein
MPKTLEKRPIAPHQGYFVTHSLWRRAIVLLPVLFIALVVYTVNWRCPACQAAMGNDWNPTFCAKCGIQLQATERPMPGSSLAAPKKDNKPDGGAGDLL